MNNSDNVSSRKRGGHCPMFGFGFPVVSLVPVWGEEFFP